MGEHSGPTGAHAAGRWRVAGEWRARAAVRRLSLPQRVHSEVRGVSVARGVTLRQQEHSSAHCCEHLSACALGFAGRRVVRWYMRCSGAGMGSGGAMVRVQHAKEAKGGRVHAVERRTQGKWAAWTAQRRGVCSRVALREQAGNRAVCNSTCAAARPAARVHGNVTQYQQGRAAVPAVGANGGARTPRSLWRVACWARSERGRSRGRKGMGREKTGR